MQRNTALRYMRTGRRATAARYGQGTRRNALIAARRTRVQRRGYSSVPRVRGAAVTGEMKYMDSELQTTNIAVTTTTWVAGTMVDPGTTINIGAAAVVNPLGLCAPTVGAALNQRIGRQIKVLKIKINGFLFIGAQAAQAAADPACKVRLMLVQDMQTNAAQMTGAQLMNDAGVPFTTLESFQNPNNFGRFRVLKDKRFTLSNLNITGSPTAADVIQTSMIKSWKMNVRFRVPVPVHFNATNGGTTADIVDNSFHVVCATDNGAYVPQIGYYSRVAYKE